MLQLSVLKDQTELVIAGLTKRNYKNAEAEIAAILEIDQRRRKIQLEHDDILARSNSLAKEIGNLMKSGKKEEAEKLKAETADLKANSKILSEELTALETELQN
jgi:seryl-tRNA synthetase